MKSYNEILDIADEWFSCSDKKCTKELDKFSKKVAPHRDDLATIMLKNFSSDNKKEIIAKATKKHVDKVTKLGIGKEVDACFIKKCDKTQIKLLNSIIVFLKQEKSNNKEEIKVFEDLKKTNNVYAIREAFKKFSYSRYSKYS
jgi:hypothetical protein